MGIGPAIIQHKDLSKKQISDIFIFTVFVGLLVSIGFILFSYPLAMFYDNRVYISLGIILSIGIFFNVVNMVPNALLLKDKQFKALGIRTVVITIIGGIITIILAIKGAKYYALVINSVFVGFLTFVFNYWYSKINIYWGFSLESIKKIKEFSSYQFGFNFINYFSRNSDNLLIGKFMGEVALGYYDKAYRLMLYPVQNLTHVITPVLHPILSDYQDDYDKIYSQYVKVVKILSLLGVFILVFCFFSAKEIILRN
ncbi:polysaccharide biosynthesis protein [Clostridium sp. CAG:221]|nr:polysaccharide biosynthesis protein [Clostridium sp. CAG:221]